jgi:hypothetical protein
VISITTPTGANAPSSTLAGSTTIVGNAVSLRATANNYYGTVANQNYNIVARASGAANNATYNVLNVGTPANIVINSGDNQSGNLTGNFSQTLALTVKDRVGNNIPRQNVTLSPTMITANGSFGSLVSINGLAAGSDYTAQTDANGNITGVPISFNGIGGLARIVANATAVSNAIRQAGTALGHFTEGAVGINVQNGTRGRSFVNAVAAQLGHSGLAASLAANQIKIQYLGYSGTDAPIDINRANAAANSTNINWNYGANGITGDPNSQNGDGVYQIAVDYNNDGVYETKVKFHRLFGDVNGDAVVDTLDYNAVLNATVYGKLNVTSGENTNGVGQVYTKDVTTVLRQRGRKVTYNKYN